MCYSYVLGIELENVQLEGIKSIKFYVVCSQFEMKNKLLIGSPKHTKSKSLAYFTSFIISTTTMIMMMMINLCIITLHPKHFLNFEV